MKKIYFSFTFLLLGSYVNAQVNATLLSAKNKRDTQLGLIKANKTENSVKAEGDVYWSSDFSTPADWTISNAGAAGTPPHTGGDWAIVNAMPASLTSQAGSYGFPTAMLSTSGGNFALIDSDGAGASASQNALISKATGINMAALLLAAGSAPNAPLYVKFTEIYRHYLDKNFVEISNDGGTTWFSFATSAEPEVPVNTNSANPETEVVNITSVIGAGNWGSDVRIRFRYQGQYDWFWGIDDVKILEAWQNDIKVVTPFVATPVATTNGLDYRMVPASQTSFPGLTFGAFALNNGSANQASVSYNVTDGGAYNETGTPVAIASGATDSISVTVPFMVPAAVGSYDLDMKSSIPSVDSDLSNNANSISVDRTSYVYGRDDNNLTGAIAQVTSQDAQELWIGNMMDIFDDMEVTSLQVRLINQSTAVGQDFNGEIRILDAAGDFVYLDETEYHSIVTADLNSFVTLKFSSPVTLTAGSTVLVLAHHLGGANEVGFGMAQAAVEQTVLGITADGTLFSLTSPNAIMVRLSEDPSVGISENDKLTGVKVYPNPSTGVVNVTNDLNVANTITVTDLTGKVVTSKVASSATTIDLSNAGTGIYLVEISNANGKKVERVVIK